MWARTAGLILRLRLFILLAIVAVTVVMAYYASQAQMTYTMANVLPENDPENIAHQKFKKLFGEDGNIMVIGFEHRDIFQLDIFNDWYQLSKDIQEIEDVKGLLSITGVFNLTRNDSLQRFEYERVVNERPKSQIELDSIKKVILNLPFYKGLLINENDSLQATLMAITLDKKSIDQANRHLLINKLTDLADAFASKHKVDVHYSGLPYIRTANSIKIKKELGMFLGLSLLVTGLVLLLFFRSFKAIIVPMIVVSIAVIWCLGTMVLLGFKITILTGLIPPLIVIIGIPNSIFLTNKYHVEYKGHGNKIKAITRVVQRIGKAAFLTNFNNSLGFVTFAFTQSDILREFGILSSINIMQVFFLSITILPIFYSYINPPKPKQYKHLENKLVSSFIEKLVYLVSQKRKLIYFSAILIVVLSAIGMSQIKTTGNFTDDINKGDQLMVDLRFFESNFHGVMPFEIMVDTKVKNGVMKISNLRKIDKLQNLLSKYPEFSKPVSIVEVVKFSKQAFYLGEPNEYALPNNEEAAFLLPYAKNAVGMGTDASRSFLDSNRQITRISVQMADIGTTEMNRIRNDVQPRIDSIFNPEKYDISITGSSIVFLKGTKVMIESLIISLIAGIILISGLMFFMFYSFKMLLVSVVPNIIPLMVTASLMGFYGISLKSSTILVFNIAYAIIIDSAIHFFSKYGADLKANNNNIKKSVLSTMRETNVSIIYTSTILLVGFCIFMFSKFGGTIALGFLVSVTIFVGMFTNLLLLPSILLSIDQAFKIKVYKEPLIMVYDEEEDINLDNLKIRKNGENEDNDLDDEIFDEDLKK
jgi:predicted RND superfamily exporter protein